MENLNINNLSPRYQPFETFYMFPNDIHNLHRYQTSTTVSFVELIEAFNNFAPNCTRCVLCFKDKTKYVYVCTFSPF